MRSLTIRTMLFIIRTIHIFSCATGRRLRLSRRSFPTFSRPIRASDGIRGRVRAGSRLLADRGVLFRLTQRGVRDLGELTVALFSVAAAPAGAKPPKSESLRFREQLRTSGVPELKKERCFAASRNAKVICALCMRDYDIPLLRFNPPWHSSY